MTSLNIKSVIEQIDLVEYANKFTDLSPSGSQWRGVCPICHHGNESEFAVYDHKSFFCYVCKTGGDIINLVQHIKGVDFFGAVEILAEEFNIDILRDKDYQKRKSISLKFKDFVRTAHNNVSVVQDYLTKKRGLTVDTINTFELGANQNGDVVIPFVDENNRHVGIALRKFEGKPKYINSKNNELFTKAEFLFNFRNAKSILDNELYLVEGFFCAMTLHQFGYPAAAYNSSQLSKQQCIKLQNLHKTRPELTVVIVPDNDGLAYPMLAKSRRTILNNAPDVPFQVLILPKGIKDVNDLHTAGRFNELDECPLISLDEFALRFALQKCSSRDAERKIVEKFILDVKDPVIIDLIADMLAERWNIDKSVALDFLKVSKSNVSLKDDFKDPDQCYQEMRAVMLDPRLQYGITALDDGVRGGGRRKDVTFIGASAGAGKTFLTVQMCVDMIARQGKNAVFFSMEMSAGALYERVLSCLLQISTDELARRIRDNNSTVEKSLAALQEHLYIVDKNGLTIDQIDAYVKEANSKLFDGKLDVVFIDYIQYMRGCTEYQVLAETAKGMKPLAKDNNIHVVVISQLNRGANTWEKPNLGNLKGGGDLEASADNVFLLWRPYSDPKKTTDKDGKPLDHRYLADAKNEVMLCVAKARNGSSVDDITLVIDPNTSRMKVK